MGFEQAGFEVAWANEYDKSIWATYEANFKNTILDRRSIRDVDSDELLEIVGGDVDGMIGGPPCQSWSEAGSLRGIEDQRGQLFFEYIRLLKAVKPKFFLAENVSGLLFGRHSDAVDEILARFRKIGYWVDKRLVNASEFGVPQDRDRVIIVGYHRDWFREAMHFRTPSLKRTTTLEDAIGDLRGVEPLAAAHNETNGDKCKPANHEYMLGGHSSIFMSRQRVRSWSEPSFTIQAGARHAPLHPQAPKMVKRGPDHFEFAAGSEDKYRRLSVREAARIQGFPDNHIFHYDRIADGYKMVGNAVPVLLARIFADHLKSDLREALAGEPVTHKRSAFAEGKRKYAGSRA